MGNAPCCALCGAAALSPPRTTCVETTTRTCTRCCAETTRRDDCAHVTELRTLREAMRAALEAIHGGRAALAAVVLGTALDHGARERAEASGA